jgi:hypothetical protein
MAVHLRPSAPPGATVKLRQESGQPIEADDLVTLRRGKTLHCIVLGPNSPVQGPVLEWTWTARNKRREP